jgi:hypothetical protein
MKTSILLVGLVAALVSPADAQRQAWRGVGVSKGAPLPPAEDFKPRPRGAEVAKAGLKPDGLATLDVEMQRHVRFRDGVVTEDELKAFWEAGSRGEEPQ